MMSGEEQQPRALYELCALLLSVLRSPHLALPSTDAPQPLAPAGRARRRGREQREVTPAGFASLLLGASLALMLCGSVTFVVGFVLLPWVLGLVMMFYFVGIVSNLSGLGRALLCPQTPAHKEMPGSLLQKSYLDDNL